ncbi:gustatory receptor 5a for trehalose-like [Atheta coriaria]|uniref:gustatory receptor 5a for trehalose-like n=1 Tax=Dalotia coriaria TaxID=877792 RepID=UPI0031F3A874
MCTFSGIELHENTKRILVLSQCFGLIPVSGVLSGKLKYKRSSFKVRYSYLLLAAHFVMASMTIGDLFFRTVSFRSCNVIMIYVPGFLMHWQFLNIGQDWPELMQQFRRVEELFKSNCYKTQKKRKSLFTGTLLTTLFILSITICEYSFSIASVYDVIARTGNVEDLNVWKVMIKEIFSFITDYVRYSSLLAFVLLTMNFYCTFIWNFMDLFIIIMCNAIARKFEAIGREILKSSREELENEYYWQKMREDYNQLAKLFYYLDQKISGIVLLSFASNMYFILVQLFRSLSLSNSNVEKIYFVVSFGMLLLRTGAVSIVAARLNDSSRTPLTFLTLQPSEYYCPDLERLILQISQDDIALSGYKSFKITRGFLFRIAGTIVTYELFLFQFNLSLNMMR